MARSIRPLGDILLDIEPLILELTDEHDLQWGDVLSLIHVYLKIHCPDSQEEYTAGGNPEFYYGPKRRKKK